MSAARRALRRPVLAGVRRARRSDASTRRPSPTSTCPGVDTREFTPREKHEFSQLRAASSPRRARTSRCPSPSASSRSARARRACRRRTAIAKAVREGMAREQVEGLYKERFDVGDGEGHPARRLAVARARGRRPSRSSSSPTSSAPSASGSRRSSTSSGRSARTRSASSTSSCRCRCTRTAEIAARAGHRGAGAGQVLGDAPQSSSPTGSTSSRRDLDGYAAALGLDLDRFRADMQSPAANGAPRRRPEARRRPGRQGHADDLHQRPRVRLEGRHRRVGRSARLRRGQAECSRRSPMREGGRARRMRVLPDGAALRRDRAPPARGHPRPRRGAGGRRAVGRAAHRARRRRDDGTRRVGRPGRRGRHRDRAAAARSSSAGTGS